MYLERTIEKILLSYLKHFSAVALTGPRQSGKSTLLKHLLKDYTYISFDHSYVRDQFYDDPEKFIKIYNNKVIFDEAQKAPEIFEYVKIAVDNDRRNYGKFVLTGSNQFNLVKGISESLAGRVGLLTLLPLQLTEIPNKFISQSMFGGSFPELVIKNYSLTRQWYSSYISTYLEKDIHSIRDIGNLNDFQRLIKMLAANTSQILDMTHYANDIGVSVNTIKKWISVLEASYIIFSLPPFYKNFGKRITKRPKIYFYDTGLVAYLTGITTKEQFDNGLMAGQLFENYIVSEILKKEKHNDTDAEFFYLRTSNKEEIDIIIDRKTKIDYIEIKKSMTYRLKMLSTIEKFITKKDNGLLVYQGENLPNIENIQIINYKDYLKGKTTCQE